MGRPAAYVLRSDKSETHPRPAYSVGTGSDLDPARCAAADFTRRRGSRGADSRLRCSAQRNRPSRRVTSAGGRSATATQVLTSFGDWLTVQSVSGDRQRMMGHVSTFVEWCVTNRRDDYLSAARDYDSYTSPYAGREALEWFVRWLNSGQREAPAGT